MNTDARFLPSMRQLRAFAAVYHLRKVSAAAEQLSVTQSAVSLSLRQLEEGLGARLFDRTTRTLQPTQAAHEAIVLAERILRDAEALGAGTLELSQLRRGRVSVAVTPTLAELLLPAAVVRFRERHPGIHVDINDCAPDQFVSRVVGEQVDFGIGVPEQAGADVDTDTLVRDHLAVVCPAGHALAGRSRGHEFKPTRLTPSHKWASEQGAVFVEVGAGDRRVGRAEIDGLGLDLLDAGARTHGLVVQADTGSRLVQLGPLGIDRERERGAGAGDVGGLGGAHGEGGESGGGQGLQEGAFAVHGGPRGLET